MENPNISVIVPIYNGENYIKRCIESILNQSYKNIEIILINDNSTDSTNKIIAKYLALPNVKAIINNQRIGPAESRNIGLSKAKSPYILFLDCDDWIDLNCIERAITILDSDSTIDIAIWEIKTAYYSNNFSVRYQYQYNNILDNKMALNLLSHTFENEYFISY